MKSIDYIALIDRELSLNNIAKMLAENSPDALLADGFDEALTGWDYKGRAVYSIEKIISIMMDRDNVSEEDAWDFFSFNIGCAYMGEMTPIYVYTEH